MVASASGNAQGQRPMAGGADGWVSSGRGGECGPGLPRMQRPTRRAQPGWGLETGAAPTKEQTEQGMRGQQLRNTTGGTGMCAGCGGCDMRGARSGGLWLHLALALGVINLPLSVLEELHDGVEGSTPPSRHVGSNHDTCRSCRPAGDFAGGCDGRRGAENLCEAWAA